MPLTTLGQIVEFFDPFRRIVEIDCIFELPDFLGADGRDLILGGEGNADIFRGKTVGMQGVLIEIDLHLPDHAAVRRRQRRAGDSGKLRPDKVQPEIVKSGLR